MTNQPMPNPSDAVYAHEVPAERPWSRLLKRGQTLRIVDIEGQQAVDALLYCAEDPTERYSAQDTMRVQGSAYVELGTRLVSNRGRVMARITADYLRTARHLGRLLFLREQRRPLRRVDEIPARVPGKFRSRALQIWLGQARHRRQSELLHERADRSVGKLHGRRRHLCRRQSRRHHRGHGRHLRDFQLPPSEQSVQRLQPDARPGARLGPAHSVMGEA